LGFTGLTITKLDGTAKGGVLLAIAASWRAVPLHRRRRAGRGHGCPSRPEFADGLLKRARALPAGRR
jgi:hypothetical protein